MKRFFFIITAFLIVSIGCKQKTKDNENNILNPHLNTIHSYTHSFTEGSVPSATNYYNNGCNKLTNHTRDYSGAIIDFDRAIELNPVFIQAYQNRGYAKANLQDFMGAIADYNKVLEIKDNDANYHNDRNNGIYSNRGVAKYNLQDYRGAIDDFSKAILIWDNAADRIYRANAKFQIEDFYGVVSDCDFIIEDSLFNRRFSKYDKNDAYYWRGLAKIELGRKESGCLDLSKAGELGLKEAYDAIKKYCQ